MADLLYKVADEVCVKVREGRIVASLTGDYEQIINVEIIAIHDNGYFVFVPSKYSLQGSIYVDKVNARKLDIAPRFLDSNINYVNDDQIVRLYHRREGCACTQCEEFYHLAEPNQADGTLVCWLCKQNPYR